ncbi:hypothetical protein BKH21_09630 [Actinomyces oris]|nr:hypothetical protein BKH22_07165 [Actinomyces oris]OLO66358.1 hypothetical protein BKH21_09630 [Actinomyces oris]
MVVHELHLKCMVIRVQPGDRDPIVMRPHVASSFDTIKDQPIVPLSFDITEQVATIHTQETTWSICDK